MVKSIKPCVGTLFLRKSGAEATAVQTLARLFVALNLVKRLESGSFTAAFSRPKPVGFNCWLSFSSQNRQSWRQSHLNRPVVKRVD